MNYYIQGDAANADQIKAAFEKLGYDTTGHLFNAKSVLYFTLDGGIRATTCNCTPAIIKTHPDYQELELPVEPKFKVGDWITCVDDDGDTSTEMIEDFWGDKVRLIDCDGVFTLYPKSELKQYHLWSIADAKDGDVLATDNIICIFRKLDKDGYYIISPCVYTVKDGLEIISDENDTIGSYGFKPATKEDRELLFRKMKEAGYEWNADKKELRKIQPHYDIANFKPFDKVLVRDSNSLKWTADLFSYIDDGFVCTGGIPCRQCIPFEGNKHLLGTTDMPSEEYINW